MNAGFNMNPDYPLEDFLEDLKAITLSLRNNVIDFPQEVQSIDENGEPEILRLNTKRPLYKMTIYFQDKYSEKLAESRQWRFMAITSFIKKHEPLLIQNGLVMKQHDGRRVSDDFIEYLLKLKINPKTGIIPKNAIKGFLKSQTEDA
jgi:hypothetical protein